MSRQIILAAAGLIVLTIVGVFAFAYLRKTPTSPKQTATEAESFKINASIKDILEEGRNLKCDATYPPDQIAKAAQVYTTGNRLRADFILSKADTDNYEAHYLSDGSYVYVWLSSILQGTKRSASQTPSQPQSPTDRNIDINQRVDLDCAAWPVDNAVFSPPPEVNFRETGL